MVVNENSCFFKNNNKFCKLNIIDYLLQYLLIQLIIFKTKLKKIITKIIMYILKLMWGFKDKTLATTYSFFF